MQNNGLIGSEIQDVPKNGLLTPDVGTEKEKVKKEIDPIEAAAIFINQSHKHFRRMVSELGKNASHRILEAVLFEPLESVKLTSKTEKQFLAFCNQILYNKGVLMNDIIEKHQQKLQKQGENNG